MDGTYCFAPREALKEILTELAKETRMEEIKAKIESGELNLRPQGLVAAWTPSPQIGEMGCLPPQETPAKKMLDNQPVLHEDGTWDCACGTKGLTGKFCFHCGAIKPSV